MAERKGRLGEGLTTYKTRQQYKNAKTRLSIKILYNNRRQLETRHANRQYDTQLGVGEGEGVSRRGPRPLL